MRVTIALTLLLAGCAAQGSGDAGHFVLDAELLTNCDQVRANPAVPHAGVVGTMDTHLPCVASLSCGVDCANAMCEDGTLRVSEAGRVCIDAAIGTDALTDAGPIVTNCDEVSASPSIPHGAVVGVVDTHIACVAPLICSVDCVDVMCEGGTLRVSEAGHLCNADAGPSDAATDAGQ